LSGRAGQPVAATPRACTTMGIDRRNRGRAAAAHPVTWRRSSCGRVRRSPRPSTCSYHATQPAVSVVLTSADCRQQVLEADVIGDEEEGLLLDHLLAV